MFSKSNSAPNSRNWKNRWDLGRARLGLHLWFALISLFLIPKLQKSEEPLKLSKWTIATENDLIDNFWSNGQSISTWKYARVSYAFFDLSFFFLIVRLMFTLVFFFWQFFGLYLCLIFGIVLVLLNNFVVSYSRTRLFKQGNNAVPAIRFIEKWMIRDLDFDILTYPH
jgi:hypothetical protein